MAKQSKKVLLFLISILLYMTGCNLKTSNDSQILAVPSGKELNRSFGKHDERAFRSPPKVYHPETYIFFIGGNVATRGITADIEAISEAGISGVLLFHGQFGGAWPGVTHQIPCLSDLWDDAVRHTAGECQRLGLRFSMLNCPGWSMSGGPWIEPSNAMRHLVWSRAIVEGGTSGITLTQPQPSEELWRDYKDVAVLAFPMPLDDTGEPLKPLSVKSNRPELPWMNCLTGNARGRITLSPAPEDDPHWVEVTFSDATTVRTVEFSSIRGFSHWWNREPGVTVTVEAIFPD